MEADDDFMDILGGDAGAAGDFEPGDEEALYEGDLQDPRTIIRQQCELWLEAARRWRFDDMPRPNAQASPAQVANALVDVRARLDSVEVILGSVMSTRSATAMQARELEQAADDAWDRQAEAERRRPRPEWQGAKERYAYWNLAIRTERQRAREARALADLLRDTYDRVRLSYDGLNDTRRDLTTRLTHARWEIHMEQ